MTLVRCISCRTTFSEVDSYLVHSCEPNPSTAAGWEEAVSCWANLPEDFVEATLADTNLGHGEAEKVLDAISSAVSVLDDLDAELERIENELAELDDPFFADDDEDDYPTGFATLAVVSVLSIGFFGLLSAAAIARAIGRVFK